MSVPVKTVLLLAGTAEARAFAGAFARDDLRLLASLAGMTRAPRPYPCETRSGGFGGVEGLGRALDTEHVVAIVDATHPFATGMSENARLASAARGIPHIALMRPAWVIEPGWQAFPSLDEAVHALPPGASVLATTGRKMTAPLIRRDDLMILLRSVEGVGDLPPHIRPIDGRGPFTIEAETALMQAKGITHLLTRNAGGDSRGRLDAARALGIPAAVTKTATPVGGTGMESDMKRITALSGLAALTATPALAHHPLAGASMETFTHGVMSGIGHPLLGFDHFFFVVAVGLAAAMIGRLSTAPLAYLGAMVVGVFLAYGGMALPGAELVIAASLIVVGGLVAAGTLPRAPVVLALFAGAGLFHGWAFGGSIAGQEAGIGGMVLVGYLLGLAVVQYAVAIAAGAVLGYSLPSFPTRARLRAVASGSRPCRKCGATRSCVPSCRCGWPPGHRASASAGFRSSIPTGWLAIWRCRRTGPSSPISASAIRPRIMPTPNSLAPDGRHANPCPTACFTDSDSMPQKIPATVITGFLGAGKTTLIRNLLQQANGKRIALVINEFGDIGVDGDLLKGCGIEGCTDDDVIELSNGCICCTVADDFIPTIETLLGRADPPDHIVIETSGLALPQPLVRAFNWPEIRTRTTIDGVVTVVDGPALSEGRFAHDEARVTAQREADDSIDHETPLAELFEDQLACADIVVVSKTDTMAGESAQETITALGARTRDGVRLVRSGIDGLSPDVLLGLDAGAEGDVAARHEIHHHHHDHDDDDHDHHHDDGHHHGHDEFDSFAMTFSEIADVEAFRAKVEATIRAHDVLRVKGFLAVEGKPMRMVIQAVGPRIETYFDRPFGTDARQSALVVIGMHGLDEAAIRGALAV